MRQQKKKHPFKRIETGYHRSAKQILAKWVNGKTEKKFMVDKSILFVPDIACYKNGILECLYEVTHKHPLQGRKLALIEYWCYRNSTELVVYEVSADYILAQTEKPEFIRTMECYVINPFKEVEPVKTYIPVYEYAD